MDQYIGKKYKFKVIKFNKKRGNIVLSRRALLEEERESLRTQNSRSNQRGFSGHRYRQEHHRLRCVH